jgi:hypothetical protein
MALVKYNNNSISAVTSAASVPTGALTLIKTLTASSSATLSFVHGADSVVLDSTYPIYKFTFNNIHSSSENSFQVNFRDGGSAYDAVKTSAGHRAYHFESDSGSGLGYEAALDVAESTAFQGVGQPQSSADNDSSGSGFLYLFNPSSTTFVKHYMSHYVHHYTNAAPGEIDNFMAGYCNTTTAIDGVQFKFDSGNIDAGTIKLYGLKDS